MNSSVFLVGHLFDWLNIIHRGLEVYNLQEKKGMRYDYHLPEKDWSFAVHLRKAVVVDVVFRKKDFILVTRHCALEEHKNLVIDASFKSCHELRPIRSCGLPWIPHIKIPKISKQVKFQTLFWDKQELFGLRWDMTF